MDISEPIAVIGANSWGSAAYGKLLRGSSVDDATIRKAMDTAKEKDLLIFDLAQDYGLGKAQKMIGEFGTDDIYISAKFTPGKKYVPGQVRKSLERDLSEFKRDYVDIYWLHLPTDIEQNLAEIIVLYNEGKIRHGRLVAADRRFMGLCCACGRPTEHLPADACLPCSSRLVVNKTVE